MALTAEQATKTYKEMVREILKDGAMPFLKDDIKGAIAGIVDVLENNTTVRSAINNGLPEPFKSNASLQAKAAVLGFAAMRLAGK